MRRFVVLFTLVHFMPSSGHADFYLHVWENHYQREKTLVLSPEVQYFMSSANYDAAGNASIPSGFTDLSRIQADVNFRYGVLSWLAIYGRGTWARQVVNGTSTTSSSSTSSDNLGTSYGFTDQTVGFDARVLKSRVLIDAQVQVDFPAYANAAPDTSTSTSSSTTSSSSTTLYLPNLGDGSIDISGGAFVTWPFLRIKNHALSMVGGSGLTYRTSGFSMAIPYSLALRYDPYTDGIKALVGAYGFQSLSTDAGGFTSCSGAGGSCISNAVNPSGMYLRAQAGYQIDPRMNVTLTFAQSLYGQSMPNSTAILAAFQMGFDFMGKRDKLTSTKTMSSEPKHSSAGFANYNLESHVKKVNDRQALIKIDKGSQEGIEEGQNFDVFTPGKGGQKMEAIAKASVVSVAADEATLKITEYYKEVWIEEGFIVKKPLE